MDKKTKVNTVEVDTDLVIRSVKKAKEMNIATGMNGLLKYLLVQINTKKMPLIVETYTLDWDAHFRTSVSYNGAEMAKVKDVLKKRGFAHKNTFVVNLLFSNFINQ